MLLSEPFNLNVSGNLSTSASLSSNIVCFSEKSLKHLLRGILFHSGKINAPTTGMMGTFHKASYTFGSFRPLHLAF